jgi:hypothetical protein
MYLTRVITAKPQSSPWHLRIHYKRIGAITQCGGSMGLVFTSTTNNLSLDALFGGRCDRHLMLVRFITLVLMLAIQ